MNDLLNIWAEVKANHAVLGACALHDFVVIDPSAIARAKYRCARCGGTVGATEALWYGRGLVHAAQPQAPQPVPTSAGQPTA